MSHHRDQWLQADNASLLRQCDVDTYRASGPGGQKRNKTDSAVRLRHHPSGLSVIAVESRSQHENRERALKRLRNTIALKVRLPLDPGVYLPGPIVRQCLTAAGKLHVGRKDHRYNQVVAELLDLFVVCRCRVALVARKLGVSTGNLVSFLQADPKLWAKVNEMRHALGVKPLR